MDRLPKQNTESIQVSVLIAAYKHGNFIAKCLDSVISQKVDFKYEILVGVDESGDDTLKICQEYEKRHPELIKVYLNDPDNFLFVNGRRVGRLNFINIFKRARGKYLARLDGDDYWTDSLKLQMQFDLLEEHPDCAACHHWHIYVKPDENGNFVESPAPTLNEGYLPNFQSSVNEIFANRMRIKTRTLMFRNIFNPLPDWFFKITFGDIALSMIIGLKGDFLFIDKPMAAYRQTGKGASSIGRGNPKFFLSSNLEYIRLWEYADKASNYKYHAECSKTISKFYTEILMVYKFERDIYKECRQFIKKELPLNKIQKFRRLILLRKWYKEGKQKS